MLDKQPYLTLCTFSFEIEENSAADTRCLIQDTVSPYCGDKKNDATLHETFSAELLCHDVISLECGENHNNVSNGNKATA